MRQNENIVSESSSTSKMKELSERCKKMRPLKNDPGAVHGSRPVPSSLRMRCKVTNNIQINK